MIFQSTPLSEDERIEIFHRSLSSFILARCFKICYTNKHLCEVPRQVWRLAPTAMYFHRREEA